MKKPDVVDKRQLGLFDVPLRLVDTKVVEKKKAKKPSFGVKDLSDDQRIVYESVEKWRFGDRRAKVCPGCRDGVGCLFTVPCTFKNDKLLTVGGYAGTGKSSILGVFAAEHADKLIAFATYTGRAASVLQRKLKAAGVATTSLQMPPRDYRGRSRDQLFLPYADRDVPFCGTLHKLLYAPIINGKEEVIGWRKREELDRNYDLIVVDEASMVGDDMLLDLQHHGVPILAVGDHGQLPPVMASGNLMARPELRLVKIHRQAKSNPIILFARHVRKTGELSEDFEDGKHIVFESKRNVDSVLRDAYRSVESNLDVAILCWTNRARVKLNLAARKALGYWGAPEKDEVLICLKNMQGTEIYNGMRGVVAEDCLLVPGEWSFDCRIGFPEEGIAERVIEMCGPQFNREKVFGSVEDAEAQGLDVKSMSELGALFDFGHALTVHRSQGSQMRHVIFYVEEGAMSDAKFWQRFAYTAVTRSSQKLTVLT